MGGREEEKERGSDIMESSEVAYKPKSSSSQFKKEAKLPEGRSHPSPVRRRGTRLCIFGQAGRDL